jgi:hypothetical protein
MDRDGLSALDHNYLDASRIFVGGSDRGEYLERRDVAIACCGLPVPEFNWGFVRPPFRDVAATAAAVQAYFEARQLPFQIQLREKGGEPAARELEALGWRRQPEATPGLTLATSAAPPPKPAELGIEEVRDAQRLVAYREAAFRGFGYPVAAARLFLTEDLLELPQARLYAGCVEGQVVATSMLISSGTVAGIYWVATLEPGRRRGYGAALTWAAVEGGRRLGCQTASLQASKAGLPVYTRMGFEHVLDYAQYLPREP